jgi:hypothetical protein
VIFTIDRGQVCVETAIWLFFGCGEKKKKDLKIWQGENGQVFGSG